MAPDPKQPGRPNRRGTWGQGAAMAIAAAAALLVVGCGSDAPEPEEKDWGDDQSQQSEKQDGSNESDTRESDDGDGGDSDDTVTKGGDGDRPDDETVAEVEQFMADYLDAENEAIQDGDFSEVKPMVEDCTICEENWSYIEGAYEDGGKVEGGRFTEPDITVGQQREGQIGVDVTSTISAYETTDGSGTEVESGEAEELRYQFSVEEIDGEWKIVSGRLAE